jgi:hypothetical protein
MATETTHWQQYNVREHMTGHAEHRELAFHLPCNPFEQLMVAILKTLKTQRAIRGTVACQHGVRLRRLCDHWHGNLQVANKSTQSSKALVGKQCKSEISLDGVSQHQLSI